MSSKNREVIKPKELFNGEGFTHAVVVKEDKAVYLSESIAWDKNFQVIG